MSNLRYLVLHTGSARFMRGKRLGQGCRIDSTKIYIMTGSRFLTKIDSSCHVQ